MKAAIRNMLVKVSALIAHISNYNKHSDAQIEDLRESLRQFGQVRSVVVQKAKANGHYTIVAGEGLTTAAKLEGFKELRADVIPASWSKTKVLAYLAADNELARHGSPDQAQLAAIIREVYTQEGEVLARLAAGERAALDALLAQGNAVEETTDVGELVDRAGELQKKWKVQRGEIYAIGKHRLMCGDTTSAEDVAKLMQGERADISFDDPPYNVKFMSRKNKTHPLDYTSEPYDDDKTRGEWESFVGAMFARLNEHLRDGGCFYIWGADKSVVDYYNWKPAHFLFHQNIIWDKDWSFLARRDFLSQHEPCVYGWKQGTKRTFNRQPAHENFSDVWRIKKINPNLMEHSAQKPVDLAVRAILTSSNVGDTLLDLFCASGTTLVACEQTGRIGRGMEISEKYCAVTLERLSLLGLKVERFNNGKA